MAYSSLTTFVSVPLWSYLLMSSKKKQKKSLMLNLECQIDPMTDNSDIYLFILILSLDIDTVNVQHSCFSTKNTGVVLDDQLCSHSLLHPADFYSTTLEKYETF